MEGITPARPVREAQEKPEKDTPAHSHSYLATANQDPELDSEGQQQPIRGWGGESGGSGGGGCEDGVFFTVR